MMGPFLAVPLLMIIVVKYLGVYIGIALFKLLWETTA